MAQPPSQTVVFRGSDSLARAVRLEFVLSYPLIEARPSYGDLCFGCNIWHGKSIRSAVMKRARHWLAQGSLFETVPLVAASPPTLAQKIQYALADKRPRPINIVGNERRDYIPTIPFPEQLPFFFFVSTVFPFPTRPTVVRFPARSNARYLDYGVHDYLRNVPGAAEPALLLEQNRILVLGLLVQMSEDMVRAVTSADDETLGRIRLHLQKIGFGFDVRVPWWNRGYRALCKYRAPPALF